MLTSFDVRFGAVLEEFEIKDTLESVLMNKPGYYNPYATTY